MDYNVITQQELLDKLMDVSVKMVFKDLFLDHLSFRDLTVNCEFKHC